MIKQKFNTKALNTINYQYDANGNVTQKTSQQAKTDYGYDVLNRLIKDNQLSYQYDGNGNRIGSSNSDLHGSTNAAESGRLEAVDVHASTNTKEFGYYSQSNQLYSINEQKIPHDEVGNLLKDDKGQEYHYNEAGKLIKVTQGENTIAEYVYNAFSQRVKKTTSQGDVYFSYDLNGQLIQESGQTQIGYLWLDGQPIAQLTAQNDPVYLISDHLNTPRIGVDKNKEIVWQWNSDAFGTTKAKGQITMSLRFPGQYEDKETGLFYNWHRYYNPTTGRYITSDPIGLNAGINTYAYVGGNPVNSYDLMGLASQCSAPSNPVKGYTNLNEADKPGEGRGEFGACRGRGCSRSHNGIDIQAPVGTPVLAIQDGEVVNIQPNPSRSYGNQVVIDHGNGIFSQSSHLDTITVSPGDSVVSGQQIGTVGRTGNTPARGDSHLHFEIRIGNPRPVSTGGTVDDPTNYIPYNE